MLRWEGLLLAMLVGVTVVGVAEGVGDDAGSPLGDLHHDASTYGMPYHLFLERFGPRVRSSSVKTWGEAGNLEPEREVFLALDEDLDGLISDEEIQHFPELVPPPVMTRELFDYKYAADDRADLEVVDAAFAELDTNQDGELDNKESRLITATLQRLVAEKQGAGSKDEV